MLCLLCAVDSKACSRCGETKPAAEFNANKVGSEPCTDMRKYSRSQISYNHDAIMSNQHLIVVLLRAGVSDALCGAAAEAERVHELEKL